MFGDLFKGITGINAKPTPGGVGNNGGFFSQFGNAMADRGNHSVANRMFSMSGGGAAPVPAPEPIEEEEEEAGLPLTENVQGTWGFGPVEEDGQLAGLAQLQQFLQRSKPAGIPRPRPSGGVMMKRDPSALYSAGLGAARGRY